MSGPVNIEPRAAAPAKILADSLPWPIGDEAETGWVCRVCGRLRVYEGGRAFGPSDRDECQECGCRLAVVAENLAANARGDTSRGRVRALIERDLF